MPSDVIVFILKVQIVKVNTAGGAIIWFPTEFVSLFTYKETYSL